MLATVAGTNGANPRIGLARLTANGAYDPSFDTDGHRVLGFPAPEYNPIPEGLALDAAGRPLVAGAETCSSCSNKGFVARFTLAGALDPAWDGDGIARVGGAGTGAPSVQLRSLVPTAGGGVVAAGDSDLNAIAVKLSSTGAPDTTFDGDGIAISDFAKGTGFAIATGFGIGEDSAGRVVLGGQATPSSGNAHGTVVRFTAVGAPDPAWGTAAGMFAFAPATMARVGGLLVRPGDQVVASGIGAAGAQNAPAIARLTAAGALDPAFGSGGSTVTAVGAYANGFGVAADPIHARLVQAAFRRLPGSTFDVRPVVLAYGDDGTPPPPTTTTTTTTTAPPPPPPAPPAPGTAMTPAATPPPATKPKPVPTFAQAVSFPSAKRCASRRAFAIRLRVPVGSAVTQAVVKVNGKRVAVRTGTRLRSTVDLRGLPKGRFTVTIELRLASGKVLSGKRAYRTCTAKRRGGKPKR